jgi:UDP:flavonoid glycosyltransferase YjiC (YdhE family)
MVITPISADQPDNARLMEEAGVGVVVRRWDAASLRAAIGQALVDQEVRSAARRVAHEMSIMPSIDDAVRELERMI